MKRTRRNTSEPAKLGEMDVEVTNEYKYLGQIQNNKNNLENHIKMIKGKVEGAYQKILSTAGNATFHNIEMDFIWKTVAANIIPIITYSGETWKMTKKEEKEINKIFDNILKRILKTPQSTARESLYIETGLTDPTTIIKRNRLMMYNRILHGTNTTMRKIAEYREEDSWAGENIKTLKENDIPENTLSLKKAEAARIIEKAINKTFRKEIEKEAENKSKVKYNLDGRNINWKTGKQPNYMKKLTRNEVSTIFKTRSRMLEVKGNYKKKYPNQICRGCNKEEETQNHVLEQCTGIHQTEGTKVTIEEIFSEDTHTLQKATKKVNKVIQTLQKSLQ